MFFFQWASWCRRSTSYAAFLACCRLPSYPACSSFPNCYYDAWPRGRNSVTAWYWWIEAGRHHDEAPHQEEHWHLFCAVSSVYRVNRRWITLNQFNSLIKYPTCTFFQKYNKKFGILYRRKILQLQVTKKLLGEEIFSRREFLTCEISNRRIFLTDEFIYRKIIFA